MTKKFDIIKSDILDVLGERPPFTPRCELCGEPVETQESIDSNGTRRMLIICYSCGRRERQVREAGSFEKIQITLIEGVVVDKKPKDTRSIWEQRVALVIDEV